MPATFAQCEAAFDYGKRAAHWSFKFEVDSGFTSWPWWARGSYDTWFEKFLLSVPLDMDLYVTPHHEPDGGHGLPKDGEQADFLAGWARFTPIIRAVNAKRVAAGGTPIKWGPTLMRASLVWSPWDIDTWCPPPEQVDFYGIDGYGEGYPTVSWKQLAEPVFAWVKSKNRPIVWAETGPWDYPTGRREEWVRQAVADAEDAITNGSLLAWMYWNEGQNQLVTDGECEALLP